VTCVGETVRPTTPEFDLLMLGLQLNFTGYPFFVFARVDLSKAGSTH
jgi:hypothetical protein